MQTKIINYIIIIKSNEYVSVFTFYNYSTSFYTIGYTMLAKQDNPLMSLTYQTLGCFPTSMMGSFQST